jgi:transposase
MRRFTEAQMKELSSIESKGSFFGRAYKRVQALKWLAEGMSRKEVSRLSGYKERTLTGLRRRYFEKGIEGLKSGYVGSQKRKMTHKEEAEILERLTKNAGTGEYVRVKELARGFQELTGVEYKGGAFYMLLKRHGWRKVMPRGQHPRKADDEAIETSKKLTNLSEG